MPERTIQTNPSVLLAEKRVLNALFHKPELLDTVPPESLLYGVSISLAKTMARMRKNGSAFSKMSLLQGAADVDLNVTDELIDFVISDQGEVDVSDALRTIAKGRQRFAVKKTLTKLIDKIDVMAVEDPDGEDEVRNELEDALLEFSGMDDESKGVYAIPEWMSDFETEREKAKHGKQFPFNNFIFDTLVEEGAEPGVIGVLTAASGSGKSTVALKLVRSLIATDVPCLYFSLEMTRKMTAGRLIASEIQVPYSEIMKSYEPTEFEVISKKIKRAREDLDSRERFWICDDASLSLADIERYIRKFQEKIKQKYCVVIIDLLSMVKEFKAAKGGMNYADSVTVAMDDLNAMVKRLGVHVLGIVQLNRSNETEKASTWEELKKFEPHRAQIKSASAYVERARYVIGAYRPMFWAKHCGLPDSEFINQMDECVLSTLKVNNSDEKKVTSIFDGEVFDILPISNGTDLTSDP